MYKSLSEAFNAAKKERQVQSKLVIWESGVSKSQFYRIINAEEAPSPETKVRIAKSLNIDLTQFDQLHHLSKSEQETDDSSPANRSISPFVYLALAIFLIGITVFIINNLQKKK